MRKSRLITKYTQQPDYNSEYVGSKYHYDKVFNDIENIIKILVEVSQIKGYQELPEWIKDQKKAEERK